MMISVFGCVYYVWYDESLVIWFIVIVYWVCDEYFGDLWEFV